MGLSKYINFLWKAFAISRFTKEISKQTQQSRVPCLMETIKPMSPQFRKTTVLLCCRLPTDFSQLPTPDSVATYLQHQCCLRYLSVWCQLISDDLWTAVVCFQPPSLLLGKVMVPVIHFYVCPIHCKAHWRVGRRIGLC